MLRSASLLIPALLASTALAQTTYDAKILEYTGLRYACEGTGTPVLKIQNTGSATMGTCVVETWKNGIQVNSFNWILAVPALTGDVRQPALPAVPSLEPGDELEFRIISVNGISDEDPLGNVIAVGMDALPSLSQGGSMEVRVELGDEPGSIVWKVTNALNQTVAAGGPYEDANELVTEDLDLPPGCYTFSAEDLTRSSSPDAVVSVARAGNVLLVAADLSVPYAEGLRTIADSPCANNLALELRTDELGSQVAWELLSADGATRYCTGTPYPDAEQTFTGGCCVPNGCYRLRVTDAGGDGIAGGGYILRETDGSGRRIIDAKGAFDGGSESAIANGEGFCLPIGTDRLISTSCDKMEWRAAPCGAEYVVANSNPAVSAQYGIANSTSGYQMWWYNPNGGYSFKRTQYHSTANGLAASATRACHFKINAWSGNQLAEGAFCNVKVRGIVAGDFQPWGPACRFMLNSAAAQCPSTKLYDLPDPQFISCNQSKAIGSGVNVFARPVRRVTPSCTWQNASRYQFRFREPGSGFELVKTSAIGKYFVNTLGLTCGKTYEVDVRASFDNGQNWCHSGDAWGDICTLSTPPCMHGGSSEYAIADGTSAFERGEGLLLFPNPSDGQPVTVLIAEGTTGPVAIEVHDASGGMAAQAVVPPSEGRITHQLETSAMAPGVYLVSARIGHTLSTARLLIR